MRVYAPEAGVVISIHALRGEGDLVPHEQKRRNGISIHALRGEGDALPTSYSPAILDFYPRPPWGGRLNTQYAQNTLVIFLSTPSVGRATFGLLRGAAQV